MRCLVYILTPIRSFVYIFDNQWKGSLHLDSQSQALFTFLTANEKALCILTANHRLCLDFWQPMGSFVYILTANWKLCLYFGNQWEALFIFLQPMGNFVYICLHFDSQWKALFTFYWQPLWNFVYIFLANRKLCIDLFTWRPMGRVLAFRQPITNLVYILPADERLCLHLFTFWQRIGSFVLICFQWLPMRSFVYFLIVNEGVLFTFWQPTISFAYICIEWKVKFTIQFPCLFTSANYFFPFCLQLQTHFLYFCLHFQTSFDPPWDSSLTFASPL